MMTSSSVTRGESQTPLVLDTRPLFAAGQTPCTAIDQSVAALEPGQTLVLIVPFEPVPLYTKLGNLGFDHCSEALPDGSWRVEFRRDAPHPVAPADIPACGCHAP